MAKKVLSRRPGSSKQFRTYLYRTLPVGVGYSCGFSFFALSFIMVSTEIQVTYPKHPSQYRTDSLKELIGPMLVGYCKSGQVVNYEKLIDVLRAQGVFKITQADDGMWSYPIYTVGKKKLHAAIRRVFNKCLVKQTKQSKIPLPEFQWNPSIEDFVRDNPHVVETGENEIQLNVPKS